MENKEPNINLRSNEVQDLIGKPPGWIVSYGSVLVLLILFGILFFSYYIKYPDVVSAPVLITTSIPPAPIVAKSSGKLTKLLVQDAAVVDSLQLLGVIENTANYIQILSLDSLLNNDSIIQKIEHISFDQNYQMGEIQNDYSLFVKSLEDIKLYKGANFKQFQLSKLNENESYQNTLNKTYQNQLNNLYTELNTAQLKLKNDEALLNKGIISSREFQESQSRVNTLYSQIEGLKASINNGKISLLNIKQQGLEISNTSNTTEMDKQMTLAENINNMKSKIQQWKSSFLLIAPCAGFVSLGNIRNENQFVETGKIIFSVLKDKESYQAKMQLIPANAGKVKEGQEVLIKLDNYPYQEYSTLSATIKNISSVPIDGKYIVEASLNKNTKTSYKKKIDMQIDMQGQADIITAKKRLISKFFDRLAYVWHNKFD